MPELPTQSAVELFERAAACLDRSDSDQALQLIDEGLALDPDNTTGRQLLEHVLRSQGRFRELLDALIALTERASPESRGAALRDAARLAAGPVADHARAVELYRESLSSSLDKDVALEAISRGVRAGMLDVGQRLFPDRSAPQRGELLGRLAERAERESDPRAAMECRAAGFADQVSADNLEALLRILGERGDIEPRAEALQRYARIAPIEDRAELALRRAELFRAAGEPNQEGAALVEAIALTPADGDVEPHVQRLERLGDTKLLLAGLSAAAERASKEEHPRWTDRAASQMEAIGDLEGAARLRDASGGNGAADVSAPRWGEEILAGNTSDQVLEVANAVGAIVRDEVHRSVLGGVQKSVEEIEAEHASATDDLDTPDQIDEPGPDLTPPSASAALMIHLLAGDVRSLLERVDQALEQEEEVDPGTWLRVGRFLEEMGVVQAARTCLAKATGHQPALDVQAARPLARQGDHREAARAATATAVPEDADLLNWVGERYLDDGDDAHALDWFNRALTQAPHHLRAATHAVELLSRTHDLSRVDELLERFSDERDLDWQLTAAKALRRRGDPETALLYLDRALEADPTSLAPALLLFDLGREQAQELWIDRALLALRRRALDQGDGTRAFVAAGLLVARGAADDAARLTHASGRVGLFTTPRAALPAGWADRWLVQHSSQLPTSSRPPAVETTDFALEPGMLDALEAAQAVFDTTGVRIVGLTSEEHDVLVWDDPPRVGFRRSMLARWLPRTFRFHLGRALSALVEPRLRPGLSESSVTADGVVVLLDRAGLLVAQDPTVALDALGAKTPRGRALTAFAVGDEPYGLWARLGLGVVANPVRTA